MQKGKGGGLVLGRGRKSSWKRGDGKFESTGGHLCVLGGLIMRKGICKYFIFLEGKFPPTCLSGAVLDPLSNVVRMQTAPCQSAAHGQLGKDVTGVTTGKAKDEKLLLPQTWK